MRSGQLKAKSAQDWRAPTGLSGALALTLRAAYHLLDKTHAFRDRDVRLHPFLHELIDFIDVDVDQIEAGLRCKVLHFRISVEHAPQIREPPPRFHRR